MGHKVNALGFRLRTRWDSLYFFKNILFLNNSTIRDILICEYINKVCFHQKKIVYDFRIFNCSNILFIYFRVFSFVRKALKRRKKFLILKKNKKNFNIQNKKKRLNIYKNLLYIKYLKLHLSKYIKEFFLVKNVFIFCYRRNNYKKFYKRFIRKNFKKIFYKKYFKNVSKVVAQSLINKSAKLLSVGISVLFKREKKHTRFLGNLKNILNKFFKFFKSKKKKFLLRGYRIEIKGKINGKPRKKKKIISHGPMPFSSLNSNLKYFFSESFTKYGVFGIKVWFFF